MKRARGKVLNLRGNIVAFQGILGRGGWCDEVLADCVDLVSVFAIAAPARRSLVFILRRGYVAPAASAHADIAVMCHVAQISE